MTLVYLTAILCGFCSAVGGIGYQIGENGGVRTIQTSVMLGVVGVLFFGLRATFLHEWAQAPAALWLLAAAVGFCQYGGMILLQKGFQLGPLSLVWCAACLQFMPAVFFAHYAYGEPLTRSNAVSLVLIVGAIAAASFGRKGAEQSRKKFSLRFGLVLLGIMLSFSTIGIGLKIACYAHAPGAAHSWLDLGPNLLMAVVYFVMALCGSIRLSRRRLWRWNRFAWLGSAMLSGGVLTGFLLQIAIMKQPGIIVFALSYCSSILLTALVSTFLMHEKRSAAWYCTLVCSLGAIALMIW